MTRVWFEKMGQEHYDGDFKKVIDYCESWGLLGEVIEWTYKFHNEGYDFVKSVSYAMTEWDL